MNFNSEYLIPVSIFIACLLLCPVLLWISKKPVARYIEKHPDTTWSRILQNVFSTALIFAFVLVASYFTIKDLPIVAKYESGVRQGYGVLFALNIIWFLTGFFDSLLDGAYLRSKVFNNGKNAIDINVIKTLKKILHFFLWFIGIIWALNILGVDIAALVTTLGIGGVAIALAAQETVKNIIGGLTILTDRTVRIGDRIIVNGIDGFVEDIGLRTTKIRQLDNRLVSIPNSKMVDTHITNITVEPTRKVVCMLGLTYDTSPEKMKEALAILKSLPMGNSKISKDVIAIFDSFGDFSLNIQFIYYIKAPRENNVFEVTSKINMAILEKFNAAGLNFAFPTQTIVMDKP